VASSRARRCGAGVERTSGGSAMQISDRNMPILSCDSSPGSGAGAGAGGGGVGSGGDGGGVEGGGDALERSTGVSLAVIGTPTTTTGQGSSSSTSIGSIHEVIEGSHREEQTCKQTTKDRPQVPRWS
jgi:hypothetical protein